MKLTLRKTIESDITTLFRNQLDKQTRQMVVFIPEHPNDKAAYFQKHRKLLKDDSVNMQIIMTGNEVVGSG
jgi:peptidase E